MLLILSTFLLANATASITTTTEGSANVKTFIKTTVNGQTTTVESNQPGTVRVVKTDDTEQVTAEVPVTITHSQTTIESTPIFRKIPHSSPSPVFRHGGYWTSFIYSLWDRMKHMLSFDLLTRK